MQEQWGEFARACTARIKQADGGGTGFFVAPRFIATCTHVLFDDSGTPIPSQVVYDGLALDLDFRAVMCSIEDDVAIVALPREHEKFLPPDHELEIGDDLYSWGYPDDYPEGDSVTLEYEGPTRALRPLLKLKGGQVRPGMSGAPLINQRTGALCGMIRLSRDRRSSLGGRAIPAATLQSIVPTSLTAPDGIYNWRQLSARLSLIRDEMRSRRLPGSTRLSVADLLSSRELLMPFTARPVTGMAHRDFDLMERLASADAEKETLIVTAPPGSGKSIFAQALFERRARPFIKTPDPGGTPRGPVPLLLNLGDYRDEVRNRDFGTEAWLIHRLDEAAGAPRAFNWSGIGPDGPGLPAETYIVLDSLDELMAGLSASEVADVFGRFMFRHARVICCRQQFYDHYLDSLPFAVGAVAQLRPPKQTDRDHFVGAYFDMCFSERSQELTARFLTILRTSSRLSDVCQLPLRLTMALDLLSPNSDELPRHPDLLALYDAYVTNLLKAEAARPDSMLSAEQKLGMLRELAWIFYDEGDIGRSDAPPFTGLEFETFVAENLPSEQSSKKSEVAEDLRNHTLLQVDGTIFSFIPGTLAFVHKSFQEFLVASWLYETMSRSAEDTASALRRYMSPEIDEFVKEFTNRSRSAPRLLTKVSENCMLALKANRQYCEHPIEGARARMASEQLGYFLGGMGLAAVRTFLIDQLETETDPWLRRGIVCGLAVGGEGRYLSDYIESLYAERRTPPPHPQNDVNIGFQLSFCGDQPFVPLTPEQDQGLTKCSKTIRQLIYQLSTEVDRGNWRINLYTILDLCRNRPVSQADAQQTLRDCRQQLQRIVEDLSGDDRTRDWPEIAALAGMLASEAAD